MWDSTIWTTLVFKNCTWVSPDADCHNWEYQCIYHITYLTHWGRVTHTCISKLTIIGSDNGLSPGRRQAIFWTNAGILLIRPLGTNLNEMLIEILTFSFMKMPLKVSSAKKCPFCVGLNVLTHSHICVIRLGYQLSLWQQNSVNCEWNYKNSCHSYEKRHLKISAICPRLRMLSRHFDIT